MRIRRLHKFAVSFAAIGLSLVALANRSGVTAQTPPRTLLPALAIPPSTPATVVPVGSSRPTRTAVAMDAFRASDSLPALSKQTLVSMQRGLSWLSRMNQANGLFLPGYIPALNRTMEDDHFLRQARAAAALAQAATFAGDDRAGVRAVQSIMTLMLQTRVDPATPDVRVPLHPSMICNRLGAAALLLIAVTELAEPQADLVKQAEELANFIRSRQKADGSLDILDSPEDPSKLDAEHACWPGVAIAAIARSQRLSNTAWKVELLRKAVRAYRPVLKAAPTAELASSLAYGFGEAFANVREVEFAETVCEAADHLVRCQYNRPESHSASILGGFAFGDSTIARRGIPDYRSAEAARGLAMACRTIRNMASPDADRYERCRSAMSLGMEYLMRLQFTDDNTQHFGPAYRGMLIGGFHLSHQEGDLRIDATAAVVAAMGEYFRSGAAK